MKITVTNRDRTADLGREVQAAAGLLVHGAAREIPPEIRELSLRLATTDAEYRRHVARLLECCYQERITPDMVPRKPGVCGAMGLRLRLAFRKFMVGWSHGRKPTVIPPEISALRLSGVASEAEYLEHLLRLMRYRDGVDTRPFRIPRRPGFLGAVVARFKIMLWSLLRYQHDRLTFRQNLINSTLTSALEFEHQLQEREVAGLKRRLAEVEARLAGTGGARQPEAPADTMDKHPS